MGKVDRMKMMWRVGRRSTKWRGKVRCQVQLGNEKKGMKYGIAKFSKLTEFSEEGFRTEDTKEKRRGTISRKRSQRKQKGGT